MTDNPREAAAEALFAVEVDGAYSTSAVLDAMHGLSGRDRALMNELVFGVLRNKLYLDFIIRSYSKLRLKKINAKVLQVLRTAVYQLLYLDKIPHSAACNEAVKLTARYEFRAKGYVNGVLRAVERSLDNLPKPTGSETEVISVTYSCPLWLTEKLITQFGIEKCRKMLKDSLLPHSTAVRANRMKISAEELAERLGDEGISAVCDDEVLSCVHINGAIDIRKSDLYNSGFYTLQNINSQRASIELAPKPSETVIDVCAAPGGKTTHIAELMNDTGNIIAFDIHKHKIALIENTAKRLGLDSITAICHNSEESLPEYADKADRVLLDAPCSGIGLIHRKPEIKYNRKAEDIAELVKIQKRILNSSKKYLKKNGVLVYSTCTVLEEENSLQINDFLNENPDFEKLSEKLYTADETGGSGFYICKLIRKN